MSELPGIAVVASPTRRRQAIDLAIEIERRGFEGIYCPSQHDAMGFCLSIAHVTSRLTCSTAILPIYLRSPDELAAAAANLHEVSQGRFRLGLGVSHQHLHERLGVHAQPLRDVRDYVTQLQGASSASNLARPGDAGVGALPPIVLAGLRDRMVDLAVELADGTIWANASQRAIRQSVARLPRASRENGFFVGNMLFTVVDDDVDAARALNRTHLARYAILPSYRNYWSAVGYADEMSAVERALNADPSSIPALLSDDFVDDVSLSGSATTVREGVESWRDAGVAHPVLVPSSTSGGQIRAIEELFATFN